jgi:hypothetical protein
MSPMAMSWIAFACILGGALFGMLLRNIVPEHHLSADTKEVVRLGTGVIGLIAAVVLGLLIGSAKSAYDTQSTQIKQLTANFILLDLILAQYGPEAHTASGGQVSPMSSARESATSASVLSLALTCGRAGSSVQHSPLSHVAGCLVYFSSWPSRSAA